MRLVNFDLSNELKLVVLWFQLIQSPAFSDTIDKTQELQSIPSINQHMHKHGDLARYLKTQ